MSRYWNVETGLLGPGPENDIVFTTEWYMLYKLSRNQNHFDTMQKRGATKAIISSTNDEGSGFISGLAGEPWSHDNHTAILSLSKVMSFNLHKTYFWKHWWRRAHPRDISYYCLLKGGWAQIIGYIFLPILCLDMILSCRSTSKKNSRGQMEIPTSGKLLAWIRFQTLQFPLTEKICNYYINKNFGTWATVFRIYFQDIDHPNNELSHIVYEKGV